MSQFVSKAIELKAERRFQTAAEMLDEAKRVLASIESGDVGESSDAARAERETRRRTGRRRQSGAGGGIVH